MELRSVLITAVASLAHEDWRDQWRASNGDAPRMKKTSDEVWSEAHDGATEVDIAATKYSHLPSDWQEENRLAAEVVVDMVLEAVDNGTELDDAFIELAADATHVAWLERNGSWAPEELKQPYADLPNKEQEKDRVIVRRAIEAYRA